MPVQKISGCVWGKLDLNLDTCGRGNFCIRKEKVADLKISGYVVPRRDQRASVKLIFKITFKFRTSSFLYPTVLPRKIHVVTRIIDTVGKSLAKLSMATFFDGESVRGRERRT